MEQLRLLKVELGVEDVVKDRSMKVGLYSSSLVMMSNFTTILAALRYSMSAVGELSNQQILN